MTLRERARRLWHGPDPSGSPTLDAAAARYRRLAACFWTLTAAAAVLVVALGPGDPAPDDVAVGLVVGLGTLGYQMRSDVGLRLGDLPLAPEGERSSDGSWRLFAGVAVVVGVRRFRCARHSAGRSLGAPSVGTGRL